jgi:hypothetical protein
MPQALPKPKTAVRVALLVHVKVPACPLNQRFKIIPPKAA